MDATFPANRAATGDRALTVFLFLLPLVVWTAFPETLANKLGDVDTWYYFGHFLTPHGYAAIDTNYGNNYFQTRLPYILPGMAIFSVLPVALAKLVFAYLIYGCIIGCLVYTLKAHLPQRVALLAALLMATDIFFVRSASWNYVDNGVLAYQALAFAALTAAARSPARKYLWATAAGFCFASMVICHLGSGIFGAPLLAYAWLCLRPEKRPAKQIAGLFLAALAGVAICLTLYGPLNTWFWGTPFFFLDKQISVGKNEFKTIPQWRPPVELFRGIGMWLAPHLAVWIASLLVLLAAMARLIRLNGFQTICLLSVVLLYAALYAMDAAKLSYFLARDGLYASFFLFLSYLAVGCLLARAQALSFLTILGIGLAFLLCLLAKLSYQGEPLPGFALEPWAAGLLFGLLFTFASLATMNLLKILALSAAAVSTLAIQLKFDPTEDVYKISAAVRQMAGDDLPKIWAYQKDPNYPLIVSVVSSFTVRALWQHSHAFPEPSPEAMDGDSVYVFSSTISSLEEARKRLSPYADRIVPVTQRHFSLRDGTKLWMGRFRIWNRISVPPGTDRRHLETTGLPAAQLPSALGRVEGEARTASAAAGDTQQGYLTYGPYAGLLPGRYEIMIEYGPSKGPQSWDLKRHGPDGMEVIVKGPLAPTREPKRITIPVTFTTRAQLFEIRTRYAGEGELTVRSIALKPLP